MSDTFRSRDSWISVCLYVVIVMLMAESFVLMILSWKCIFSLRTLISIYIFVGWSLVGLPVWHNFPKMQEIYTSLVPVGALVFICFILNQALVHSSPTPPSTDSDTTPTETQLSSGKTSSFINTSWNMQKKCVFRYITSLHSNAYTVSQLCGSFIMLFTITYNSQRVRIGLFFRTPCILQS